MSEHILLVEDNPRDVEITLDRIAESEYGLEVTVVHDGEQALDYVHRRGDFRLRRAGHPSLILLDVKMPKLDGFQVLQRLRRDPSTARIPVLMLTSSRQEQDLVAAYELKSDGYLIKPLDHAQLEATMRTVRELAATRPSAVD